MFSWYFCCRKPVSTRGLSMSQAAVQYVSEQWKSRNPRRNHDDGPLEVGAPHCINVLPCAMLWMCLISCSWIMLSTCIFDYDLYLYSLIVQLDYSYLKLYFSRFEQIIICTRSSPLYVLRSKFKASPAGWFLNLQGRNRDWQCMKKLIENPVLLRK